MARLFKFCSMVLLHAAVFRGIALSTRPDEPANNPPALNLGNARVVLVGDSITGLSRNYAAGFAHQMQWALEQAHADCKPELIALGGSGAGVTAWLSFERRSRQEEFFLDVKGNPVKATLDK